MNSNAPLPISEQDILRMYAEDNSRTNTIHHIQQNLPFIQDPFILSDVKNALQNLKAMTDTEFQEIMQQYCAPEE